jgi:hypothetical protein
MCAHSTSVIGRSIQEDGEKQKLLEKTKHFPTPQDGPLDAGGVEGLGSRQQRPNPKPMF